MGDTGQDSGHGAGTDQDSGEVTVTIDAPPERVYRLVSDVTLMSRWSPEVRSSEWVGEPGRAEVGARFRASNKRGRLTWANQPEVIAAEPGAEFAFRRVAPGAGEVVWRYRISPHGAGSAVTESYRVVRRSGGPVRLMLRLLGGVTQAERPADLLAGMAATLAALKADAERP